MKENKPSFIQLMRYFAKGIAMHTFCYANYWELKMKSIITFQGKPMASDKESYLSIKRLSNIYYIPLVNTFRTWLQIQQACNYVISDREGQLTDGSKHKNKK